MFKEKFLKKDFHIFLFYLFVWIFCYLLNNLGIYSIIFYKSIFYILFSMNLVLIVTSIRREDTLKLIFVGYITLYMVPYISSINKDVFVAIYMKEKDFQILTKTLLIYSFFLLPFLLFRSKNANKVININIYKNDMMFYSLLVIFFLMWHFGIRGQNILISGGYGMGGTKKSSIYEYLLIIIFLLYQYTGKQKKKILIFYICCFLYAAKNLLFGGRIETLMLMILVYLLIFQRKISFKVVIIFAAFFYYLMQVFSNIRGNVKSILSGNYWVIFNIFNNSSSLTYLGTNEGDVFWAGTRMLYLIKDGYLTIADRFFSGLSFIFSVLLPRSLFNGYDNLATFKRNIYGTGGGGLAPLFFYTMFSLIGVFIIGFFIAKLLNGVTEKYSVKNIYILFMIVTLPRWFAYYPIQLIKLDLISIICTIIVYLTSCFISKYFKLYNYNKKEIINEIAY